MITISAVEAGSLGERAGFRPGDGILAVNGEGVEDLVDFQVHASEADLFIEVEREGETYELEISRVPGETVGLEFGDMTLRRCNNRCVFCFLHQMPRGLRRSLYFEDDDYRLSFLHGSYVTLTNVRERDLARIIEQRLSPQYISVHATDPELRQELLGRRKPTVPILERIDLLARHQIEMHAQVVLCPGRNDGPHLERTVRDLSRYHPAVRSVALVPVGLTRFRSHLAALDPVTPALASEYVARAEEWGADFSRSLGERFVYAADELFLLTGQMPPPRSYYDAFPQIENGIGMVRAFLDTWEVRRGSLAPGGHKTQHLALVTGRLAASFLGPLVSELNGQAGLVVDLVVVDNDFFGHGITVSGLLTGQDMAARLSGGPWDRAILPPNCINGEGLTLDDLTVPALEARCGVPLSVGDYDLAETLRGCLDGSGLPTAGHGRQLSELGFSVGGGRGD
ncbi:MAG: DUF512 domain-containing protein [Gemmatimonadota bacterium]